MVKDHSPNAMIVGNQIRNIKGGMGIGGHATALGNPVEMTIIDNHINMQRSSTAFEGIGLTKGVDHSIIAYNSTTPSYDNGLSISSGHNLVVRNHVDGAWNHGIALESTHNTVIANDIRNIGQQNAALGETRRYGGIAIADGGYHLISGNTVSGGDIAYGIKYNGTQSGHNQIGHNHISGYRDSEYNLPPHPTDIIGDAAPDHGISLLTPAQIAAIADNTGPGQGTGNHAPSDLILDNTSLMENTAAATVGTLKVIDPDPNDTHNYSGMEHEVFLDLGKVPQHGSLDVGALGTQHIRLLAQDMLDTRDHLEIYLRGDSQDSITLDKTWQTNGTTRTLANPDYSADTVTYHAYGNGNDTLWIDADLQIHWI